MASTVVDNPPDVVDAGTAGSSVAPEQLSKAGPYLVTIVNDTVNAQRQLPDGRARAVQLPVVATCPCVAVPAHPILDSGSVHSHAILGGAGSSSSSKGAAAAAQPHASGPPYPVCVLLNGFQARASQYAHIARRLASWGFLVVQYNAPQLTIIQDAYELPLLQPVLDWVREQGQQPASALHARVDMNRLCIAGHSRGGKLAALHFAASKHPIRAAYLLDPVDNTPQTPEGPDYPSAAKALRTAGRPLGMTGAGILGPGNPEGANWRHYWAAMAPGSRLQVITRCGHTNFMQSPAKWEQWLLDRCFGSGPASRDAVLEAVVPCMVSWFQQQLAARPAMVPEAVAIGGALGVGAAQAAEAVEPKRVMQPVIPLSALEAWLQPMIAEGEVTFSIKSDEQ